MIWLIVLFTISICENVNLVKNTDPFSKITTIRGTTPSINLPPYKNESPGSTSSQSSNRLELNYPEKEFILYLSRINDGLYLVINQTIHHENSHIREDVFKHILGSDSKLHLLFDSEEVLSIRYNGERKEATDSFDSLPRIFTTSNEFRRHNRMVSITGKFQLSKNDIRLLKNKKLQLLRVEFSNSTTDREFNEENDDYLIKYLPCLE